jgi:hypothetical protein
MFERLQLAGALESFPVTMVTKTKMCASSLGRYDRDVELLHSYDWRKKN